MTATLRKPELRTCERCGRTERWDPDDEVWRIHADGDGRHVGDRFCIHEWDINGNFTPFED